MTPNIDRNEPPETWITAAPMDTLTLRDGDGKPIPGSPSITTIPVRFHVYWAGSDKDGSVTGFYYAVVETTAAPLEGIGFANLPGPKPQDYRFTTRTDTTFVFNVSELFTDRQHALFVYAVDNNGKPDPTPARFIFDGIDKFPPRPVILETKATGEIVTLMPDGSPNPPQTREYFVTDTLPPGGGGGAPKDTVPAFSRLDITWRGEITLAGTYVTNYRYKLDEPQFQTADSSVHSVSYGTGLPGDPPVSPGLKVFTLRALDQAGGAGETTRRFLMNFSPDTWWAGPDLALWPASSDGDGRAVDVLVWPAPNRPQFETSPPLPTGFYLGTDSLQYRPSRRLPPGRDPQRRTFYEIYKNRIYARSEGDTVHINSWVMLVNGGYDKDSRYNVRADSTDPVLHDPVTGALVQAPVVEDAGKIGSPIGFRSIIINRLTPAGVKSSPAQSSLYPIYEPASVFRSPRLAGYWRMFQAGRAFALGRAEDADGGIDNTVTDPVKLVENVEDGTASPTEIAYRRKVIAFYVDKAPALLRQNASFRPTAGQTFSTNLWSFNLIAQDTDPFDPSVESPGAGGPTSSTVIRFKVTLTGTNLAGRDTSWTYLTSTGPFILTAGSIPFSFTLGGAGGSPFASGPIDVRIQTCDCIDCEGAPGQGRCVDDVIRVNYVRPAEPGLDPTSIQGGPGPSPSGRSD